MEISTLLTILLIMISLGRLFIQEKRECLVRKDQIFLCDGLSRWAVKLGQRDSYLLNIVFVIVPHNVAKSPLIHHINLKFEG